MNQILDYFLHLLYPPKCMFCGSLLKNEDARYCEACFENLPDYDDADRTLFGFDQVIATFFYEGPVREGLLRFKFRGLHTSGKLFGTWLAGTVKDKLRQEYQIVSWVPCSFLRRWQRGYDQSELLAKAVADQLGLECVRVLRKIRHNPAQSGLQGVAKRKANVIGAYAACNFEKWKGKRILLVDDILTTGATLSECSKTLLAAGADGLACAVVAAASDDDNEIK